MDERQPKTELTPNSSLKELVLEDLNTRAQHFGFDDIDTAKIQDPNCAFTLTMHSVKSVAVATGIARQEILGTLFELTDEDMADPILDEDAPVGDRVAAFMRFADRHPEIAIPSKDTFPSISQRLEEKNNND